MNFTSDVSGRAARAAGRSRPRAAGARCCEPLEPRRLLASVAGVAYQDNDGDNVRDAGEPPLAGRTVYVDVDCNGQLNSGDRTAVTGADGTLDNPFSNNARAAAEIQRSSSIRTGAATVLPDGKILVAGGSESGFFSVARAALVALVDPPAPFASVDASGTLVFNGTEGRDEAIIDRAGDAFRATLNGETLTFPAAGVTGVRASLLGGDDVLATGNLLVPVSAEGGAGTDSLRLFGTNGGDALVLFAASVARGGVPTMYFGVETLYVAGGNGADTVTYAADAGTGTKTILDLFAGDDVVTATRGDPTLRLEIRGGAGNDAVTVVANADPAQRASITFNGDLGADTLTARGTAGADVITVDVGTFSGIGSGSGTSVETFLVEALGGADVINLAGTRSLPAVTVDAGAGDDVINLGDARNGIFYLPGDATVRGGPGNDVIHADDSVDTRGLGYFLDPDSFTATLKGTIAYDGVEEFTLNTGSEGDGLVITPSAATTYTLNAGAPVPPISPPEYGDTLMLGYGGAEGMVRTMTGTGAGQYTFNNRRPIRFSGVEGFDELKPAVVSGTVQTSPFGGGPVFVYTFNKEVSYSVDRTDLVIRNADTGEVWASQPDVRHDFETHTSTFQFFDAPPPGRYVATLSAAGIVDDAGNPLTGDYVLTFGTPSVVRQRLAFYNRSRFDGDDPALNALDDDAIAVDKSPLMSGQPWGFANVLTDPAGITGVMIDVNTVPPGAVLTAGDFVFRAGPGGTDPAGWAAAPAPSAVQVRRGGGTDGSDRISLAWPDNSVRNTWLQVTAKANERTGLAQDDVFYFASLVGESGDAANGQAGARVTALDLTAVKRALNSEAAINSRVDFNRDGRVNAQDLSIVKTNLNRTLVGVAWPGPAGGVAAAGAGAVAARLWDEKPPALWG